MSTPSSTESSSPLLDPIWEHLQAIRHSQQREGMSATLALLDNLATAWALQDRWTADDVSWLFDCALQFEQPFWMHSLALASLKYSCEPAHGASGADRQSLLGWLFQPLDQLWPDFGLTGVQAWEQLAQFEADWEKRLPYPLTPWLQAWIWHALARGETLLKAPTLRVRCLGHRLLTVLHRRLSQLPEVARQLLITTEAYAWPDAGGYAAARERLRPFEGLPKDFDRAKQAQLHYYRHLNAQAAAPLLLSRLNAFLSRNDLQLASLQGFVRQTASSTLSYAPLSLSEDQADLFAELGIYGWLSQPPQWHSFLRFNPTTRARQTAYRHNLAQWWATVTPTEIARLSPGQRYETVWISSRELDFYALVADLLTPLADPARMLQQWQLDRPGPAFEGFIDVLWRLILPPRGGEQPWPSALAPVILVAWLLARDLPGAKAPVAQLARNVEALTQRELPADLPADLTDAAGILMTLTPERWRQLTPWPLYAEERALMPGAAYICFVQPLGYEPDLTGGQHVPAAVLCGRFVSAMPPPFVPAMFRHHLQPVLELSRQLFDLGLHHQRHRDAARLARQTAALASSEARTRQFAGMQEQMRAFDATKQQLDALWQGIRTTLTPPAFAAYGILDWQSFENLFDPRKTIQAPGHPPTPGAHQLDTIQASDFSTYLAALVSSGLRPGSFIELLHRAWHQAPVQDARCARQNFALLKLVAHDGFQSGKPLSLLQLLVALRLSASAGSLKLQFVRQGPAAEDLSNLLWPDACPPADFFDQLGRLSGLNYHQPAYSARATPPDLLPLAGDTQAAEVALALTQLLREEFQPLRPDWLHATEAMGCWQCEPPGLGLWILLDRPWPLDWPTQLRPAADTHPHGLRDCLQLMARASGQAGIACQQVAGWEDLPHQAGVGFYQGPGFSLLSLQFGAGIGPQRLLSWREHWQRAAQRPEGL